METVLITGGAGFIGSHLCQRLVDDHRVICIDNLITGERRNIQNLIEHPNFFFIEHDITKSLAIDGPVDQIYDLACPASPPDFVRYPTEILEVCSVGVKNTLDLAVEKNSQLLHTSTSEVYGDPREHPQSEAYWGNVNPIGLRSCYDEGKRFAESLIVSYRTRYDVGGKLIRIFNTYGPMMRPDDGRVVSNFVTQALQGDDLTVYGEGNQTRSFCYISDMVDGIIKMMKSEQQGPINIGNPVEFTILELAETVIKLTNSSSRIIYEPLPSDDPSRRCPNIALAKTELGWEPTIDLENGLNKTIEWFASVIKTRGEM